MKKNSKSKVELERGNKFDLVLATRLVELILEDKRTRIHLEARLGYVPTKGAFDAVDLGACRKNQDFLDFMMTNCRWLWLDIDARPKQDDIIEPAAKEAQLRKHLFGEGEDDLALEG